MVLGVGRRFRVGVYVRLAHADLLLATRPLGADRCSKKVNSVNFGESLNLGKNQFWRAPAPVCGFVGWPFPRWHMPEPQEVQRVAPDLSCHALGHSVCHERARLPIRARSLGRVEAQNLFSSRTGSEPRPTTSAVRRRCLPH